MIFLIRVMANKGLMTGANPHYALELSCRAKSFDMGMDPPWMSILDPLQNGGKYSKASFLVERTLSLQDE